MFIIFIYTANIFHKEIQLNYRKSHVISPKQKSHTIMGTIKLDTLAMTETEVSGNFLMLRGKCNESAHLSNKRKLQRASQVWLDGSKGL